LSTLKANLTEPGVLLLKEGTHDSTAFADPGSHEQKAKILLTGLGA